MDAKPENKATPIIVKRLPTKIWIEDSMFGDKSVVVQHEGMEPFVYASFGYHYAYTNNAGVWNAAQNMAWSLGATDPIEVRQAEMPKMPTAEEVRMQIDALTELLATLTAPPNT